MPRPAGSKNRISSTVKDNVVRAFEDMGGQAALARWGKANPGDFYPRYMQLCPKEVIADVQGDLNIQLISHLDNNTPAEPES